MKQAPFEIFSKRIQLFRADIQKVESQMDAVAYGRLFLFIAGAVLLWLFYDASFWAVTGLCVIWTGGFLFLVQKGYRLKRKVDFLKNLVLANERELNLLNLKFENIATGKEYADPEHAFSGDMDLFGENSLFQLINRTTSKIGSDQVATWMNDAPLDNLSGRQKAILELSEKLDWRQNFEAKGKMYEGTGEPIDRLEKWMFQAPHFFGKMIWRIPTWVLVPLLILSSVLYGFQLIPYWVPLVFIGINFVLNWKLKDVYAQVYAEVSDRSGYLEAWKELLVHIEDESFDSEMLQNVKSKIEEKETKSSDEISRIALFLRMLDLRSSGLYYILLNLFFFWDLYWIFKLETWKEKNKAKIRSWFEGIAEMEAFSSLAGLNFAHPNWTMPEVLPSDTYKISAQKCAHPLLLDDMRVSNDFEIGDRGQVLLITGSNMSGKSTFLRTVGINVVLAQLGTPVCATQFSIAPLKLISSMRTTDSLSESISSFYAELRRLKRVIELTEVEDNVLFLLDEILKGTNSKDRHKGAEALIRQLIAAKGSGMVSTHDLELAKLDQDLSGQLINYSFNSQILEGDKLSFDYTLTPGPCRSFNASFLMKKIGIKVKLEDD